MNNQLTKYVSGGQNIELSDKIIKQYLVSGDADKVTDQEVQMFLSLCKFEQLNPFLKDVYLIKFGTAPATMVTAKKVFMKRAARNPKYQGHEVGMADDGQSAWAKVYVEGHVVPVTVEVDLDEYVGKKQNGTITDMWQKKKKTMLKKVALVQALREAFPEDVGNMYVAEEFQSNNPVDITPESKASTVKPANEPEPTKDEKKTASKLKEQAKTISGKDDGDVVEKLNFLLDVYSAGDKAVWTETLKEISIFGKEGDEKWLSNLTSKTSVKWARASYGKLKTKMTEEYSLPDNCPFKSDGCEDLAKDGDQGVCVRTGKACPFDADVEF